LIEVFPEVLRHQAERAQHRPADVVEVGVSVVRIITRPAAYVTAWTGFGLIIPNDVTETSAHSRSIHASGSAVAERPRVALSH